jgi:hypothetical protein
MAKSTLSAGLAAKDPGAHHKRTGDDSLLRERTVGIAKQAVEVQTAEAQKTDQSGNEPQMRQFDPKDTFPSWASYGLSPQKAA